MATKLSLIIPAAGSGTRLKTDIPKPYIILGGATILEHSIRQFLKADNVVQVIIATSKGYVQKAEQLLAKILPDGISGTVVKGGAERQDSIQNALSVVKGADLVAIHDAVRPFINPQQIVACCKAAAKHGGAIIAVPAKDTIKKVDAHQCICETPDRSKLWQAQTPQIFKQELIREAYNYAASTGFVGTDDASLVEKRGYNVKVIEGSRENFKITYPLDLQVAEILLK